MHAAAAHSRRELQAAVAAAPTAPGLPGWTREDFHGG